MEDGDITELLTTPINITDMASFPLNEITQKSDDHVDNANCDIDWVSLLSAGSLQYLEIMRQKPRPPCGTEVINDVEREAQGWRNKKGKMVRKVTRKAALARIAFHTRSAEDVLDDGYRWRKYGQKAVKHSSHPRSYYRCTHHTCNVKKQIQRHSKDPSIVVTTYEGIHNHPCEKFMETLTPLLKQLQFLSSI